MKRFFTTVAILAACSFVHAQIGFTLVPYFWSTSYRGQMYDRTNGFGNVPLGFDACFNHNNRLFAEVSCFRMMSENKRDFSNANFGYGVPGGFTHRKFSWIEARIDYTIAGKKWEDMDKWAPALAIRAGVISNQRVTMLAPQVGHDTVYAQTPPYLRDSVVPLNRFDLTGLRQTMITGGLSIKIMRKKEVDMNAGASGTWYKDMATGDIFFVPWTGSSNRSGKTYSRVRQWDFYVDYIYAPFSTYDAYQGWDDHQQATRTIEGDAIPGLENFGWRWGIKHVAYNPLGLQWVIEYQQLPGQKTMPEMEDIDEPARKNRFLIIGLNFSIGMNRQKGGSDEPDIKWMD